jgi:lysine/ornithine N-monooxygenase
MGNFGALDDLDEQIPEQGYDNCRLISVEVDTRFNATSNTDNAVLTKTYETLTSAFVEITDPTVEIEENGLAKITKTYRAVSGTKPPNKIGVQAAYAATNPSGSG